MPGLPVRRFRKFGVARAGLAARRPARRPVRRLRRTMRRKPGRRFVRRGKKAITGGLSRVKIRNPGGVPDKAFVKLRYQTTSSFTSSGAGAPSFVQIKQNSIYRPYAGNTDSCGNYQRMYAQYRKSCVMASKVTVSFWTGTNGTSSVPFRTVIIPCTSTQYTAYSAYTNIGALWDVPHARQREYSPGGNMPRCSAYTTTSALAVGQKSEEALDLNPSTTTGWIGTSGVDPGILQYFLIGYQAFAGTTAIPTQAQVQIEYYVKFWEPVATVEQQLARNYWGNEEVPEEKKETKEEKKEEPDFELIKVPKLKTPASSSKK